jgi:hypothetical protein
MAVDKQSLELLEATKELKRASSTLNAASKQFTSDGLLGTGINKIADKIGAKGALEFVMKRKQLRTQDKLLRQELELNRGQLKRLKKRQQIAQAEEQRQKAFKSLSENLLGLSEQQRQKLVSIKESKDRGDGRDSSGRFVGKMTPEAVISGALKEANKENARVAKKSGKSPGDINRAAEEERTADQQAFETEKTESTNEILRDILAAITGSGIEKKEKEGSGGGLLAGLLGLGALKKALAGVASALGLGSAASALGNKGGKGGKGGKPKMGKGLLGRLGGLAAMLGPGAPLIFGLGAAGLALYGLSLRADEFTKKVEEDSKKLTEAAKKAETPEEIQAVVDKSVRQNQTAGQEANRIRSAEEESKQRQADSERGRATENMMEKKKVIEGSQDINDLIRNASVLFTARRDSAIEQGTTLEERYAFFDKSIAETIDKVQSSEAFLGADKKSQAYMIQQVVEAANKAIAGNRGKSALLYGLGPEAMKGQAAINTRRTRAITALQYGATGKMAQEGFGYFSDLLGGGRNTFSARKVASLEADVARAQKDADEVTWYERNVGSNQGDIDRLNNLTKELERLRDTIAASDRRAIPSIIAPNNSTTSVNNSSASVSTPIYMTDPNTDYVIP